MRRHARGKERRGVVWVYFALMLFALLTMAALAIDLGLVRVTQQQMQSAVEAEALEALRFQDDASLFLSPTDNMVAANRDQARRQAAQDLTTFRYSSNPNVLFQAGPDITFTGGVGLANNFTALEHTDLTNLPKSSVQPPFLNLENEPYGDLVSGTFTQPTPPSQPTEDSSYDRNDFSATTSGPNAVLARMRRTYTYRGDVVNPLDKEDGVSSAGNAVPLLFGRAAQFGGVSPPLTGITVRATSIASSAPARTIGPYLPQALYNPPNTAFLGVPGATPFGFSFSAWQWGGTSLASTIQATDTTLTVNAGTPNAGSNFPPVPFQVLVDAEVLKVSAVDQTQTNWTVQRGVQSTTATSHGANAQVLLYTATTLANAAADATTTSISVVDGSPFPAAPFAVLIDTEILLVTAVDASQTIWTVQRGFLSSHVNTAAPHQAGAGVWLLSYFNADPQGQLTPVANVGTTLTAAAMATDTTLQVSPGSSFPAVPFVAVVDPGATPAELVQVTALDATKTSWTVQRGWLGTSPGAHQANAVVQVYQGTALKGAVQPTDMTLTVLDGSNFPGSGFVLPNMPFTAVLDPGMPTQELVQVTPTNSTTTSWAVQQRGWLGTMASKHQPGALVQVYSGQLFRSTSLSSSIGSGDTSITVSSGANFSTTVPGFPVAAPGNAAQPPFLVRIDSELLQVTNGGRNNTTWTVARAQGGTQAASHSSSAMVLLHQTLGIGPTVDVLAPPPVTVDGSTIVLSSPRPSMFSGYTDSFLTFVPVFDDSSQPALVAGFGRLQWGVSGNTIWTVRQPGIVIPQNATAVFSPPTSLTASQLNQVLTTNRNLNNSIQAPALVRSR